MTEQLVPITGNELGKEAGAQTNPDACYLGWILRKLTSS
jgi:hypothetical protein